MPFILWLVVIAVLLLLLKTLLRKPPGLPPGRWGLPWIGYVPLTRKRVEHQLMDLHQKHGDIYLWRMGTLVMVFMHDYRLIKEAYSKTDFIDRPNWINLTLNENPGKGVVGSNGPQWHNNRRFSLRQLKDLGMGKSKLVAAIQTQAKLLVKELKAQAGTPAPLPHALPVAITNIIWQMVGGCQFELSDPKLKEFQSLMEEMFASSSTVAILDFLPWMATVLPKALVNWICKMELVDRARDKFFTYFKAVIDEHRTTLDKNNPRDLIDSYLLEMKERENDPDSTFSEHDLTVLVFDLFAAGSQTTTDTLIWVVYFMAEHPEIQTKMQAEVDRVLEGEMATLEDRQRLPYTEAFIHEVLRMSSLATLGVQHVAVRDTQLGGYNIPKGCIMNTASFSVHHDRRYWEDPDQFLPERWLDADGHFVTKKEGFFPFGSGKRQCMGEGLARMELFIFTTALLQNLSFAPPPGKTIDVTHNPSNMLFHIPIPQEVLVTVR